MADARLPESLNVLFVASEVAPLAKTGGLADVAGALPPAVKRLGNDVRVIMPFYGAVKSAGVQARPLIPRLEVPLGRQTLTAGVFEARLDDSVPVYLIEREDLYDRPNLYGNALGDYYDNFERFAFLARAVLELVPALGFSPDLLHCHDWQAGLVPALLKGPAGTALGLENTPTVFTIHNLGYQGLFAAEKLPLTGLPAAEFFHPEGLEFWGGISLLKAGIAFSEAITTVSPTYAREIQTPEYGMGLDGLLRQRSRLLHGILNGVDYHLWDPAADPLLPAQYSPANIILKGRCKAALIEQLELSPTLQKKPLLGMISRLAAQKGLDLLVETLDRVLALDVGLVILGSGDDAIQQALRQAAGRHPGRMGLRVGFDETLAHRILAGADIFLIPSRYEPCGLTQMYALKYGTVPLVRATGGLEDTIRSFDEKSGEGNGFKYQAHDPAALLEALSLAVALFRKGKVWKRLMANAMAADFSWDRSAAAYRDLYRSLAARSAGRADLKAGTSIGRRSGN